MAKINEYLEPELLSDQPVHLEQQEKFGDEKILREPR